MFSVFDIYIHHGYAIVKPLPNPNEEGGWDSIIVNRWLDEARTERLSATSTLNHALGRLVERGFNPVSIRLAGPNYQQLLQSLLNVSLATLVPTQVPEGFGEVQNVTSESDQGHFLVVTAPGAANTI